MLNIPEEVKQLFRQGSVKKNIRVHFPNGEREDITNSNLISESFSFTESICSQDTLKFGLCEASMVEFETFGVGNIKDFTIEVSIEITYQENPYKIPIGVFVVDSCEKQSNLNRRKIIAYSKSFDFDKISSLEIGKRENIAYSHATRGYYDYDLFKFVASNYFTGNETFFNKTILETTETGFTSYSHHVGNLKYWKWTIYVKFYPIDTDEKLHSLYWVENNYQKNNLSANVVKEFKEQIALWGETSTEPYVNEVKKILNPIISDVFPQEGISLSDGNNYIYPYPYGYDRVGDNIFGISVPYSFEISLYNDDGTTEEVKRWELVENPKLYLVDTSSFYSFTITEKENFVKKLPKIREIVESYFELLGVFGKIGREYAVELITLTPDDTLYPSETLYPSIDLYPFERSELFTKSYYKLPIWYEDFYTLPYSKVLCSYKNSDSDKKVIFEHKILSDEETVVGEYQTYDLSENYIFNNFSFSEEEVTSILQQFSANIRNVKYMPSNINLIGLPYYETGDMIRVLTTDGGFETIILNRTLNGIQQLNDNFEAKG